MLYLLGAGSAYPANTISNTLLEELGRGFSADQVQQETGIISRGTVLDLGYLRETGNAEVWSAPKATQIAASELGYQAALQAIERAGISPEAIGLVIGESSTPIETTPSEGQRVANRLNLRCPAYDVTGNCSSFALHVETLLGWRDQALPEYVLCVYSNTPTTRINYRDGKEGWYGGDAGAAVVLSSRKESSIVIRDAYASVNPAVSDAAVFETLGHFSMRTEFLAEYVEPKGDEMLMRAVDTNKLKLSHIGVIPEQFSQRSVQEGVQRHSLRPEGVFSTVEKRGYSFGSMPASVLADHWNTMRAGDKIVAVTAGCGFSFGYVYLTA